MKYFVFELEGYGSKKSFEVATTEEFDNYSDDDTIVFSGSLADCYAYLKLREEGYM